MPNWIIKLIPFIGTGILWVAGLIWVRAVERMTGSEMPTWILVLIAAALTLTSLFFGRIIEWAWRMYQNKKLKYLLVGLLSLIVVVWMGWPWQRIQNSFTEIRPKSPIISEKWISEHDTEQFIIRKLQSAGAREVFDWRVRYLIKSGLRSYVLGRFRCGGDSTWQSLHWGPLLEISDFEQYDGAKRLSEFIDGEVEYSTEYIHKLDWVEIDTRTGINPPNPNSE